MRDSLARKRRPKFFFSVVQMMKKSEVIEVDLVSRVLVLRSIRSTAYSLIDAFKMKSEGNEVDLVSIVVLSLVLRSRFEVLHVSLIKRPTTVLSTLADFFSGACSLFSKQCT